MELNIAWLLLCTSYKPHFGGRQSHASPSHSASKLVCPIPFEWRPLPLFGSHASALLKKGFTRITGPLCSVHGQHVSAPWLEPKLQRPPFFGRGKAMPRTPRVVASQGGAYKLRGRGSTLSSAYGLDMVWKFIWVSKAAHSGSERQPFVTFFEESNITLRAHVRRECGK